MTTRRIVPQWDAYFMGIAQAVAVRSCDPSTQVGAVIVDAERGLVSTGYNGFPRGVAHTWPDYSERYERPEKYYWMEHAERNAIYQAARKGHPTQGCTLYVTAPPCIDCARAIIQAGIVAVRCTQPTAEFRERWDEQLKRAFIMFSEAKVEASFV